jgi:hypothetical protein
LFWLPIRSNRKETPPDRGSSSTTNNTLSIGNSIVMTLTTRTWHDERIPLDEEDYVHRRAPEDSSVVPHSVASVKPSLMTDYICRVRDKPLDEAVRTLVEYLR